MKVLCQKNRVLVSTPRPKESLHVGIQRHLMDEKFLEGRQWACYGSVGERERGRGEKGGERILSFLI